MGKQRIAIAIISGMLITLTACATASSSPGSAGTFNPGGGGSAAAPSPTAVATTSGLAHFPFPADVHIEFQTPLPSDPQQAAAVVADENYWTADLYAFISDAKDMSVIKYIDRRATYLLTNTYRAVDNGTSDTYVGTERFYDTTVQVDANDSAELDVTSCVSGAAMQAVNRSTGQVVPGQNTPQKNYYQVADTLAQAGGTWKLVESSCTFYPSGGAKECYP